jgi:hypothetical protein
MPCLDDLIFSVSHAVSRIPACRLFFATSHKLATPLNDFRNKFFLLWRIIPLFQRYLPSPPESFDMWSIPQRFNSRLPYTDEPMQLLRFGTQQEYTTSFCMKKTNNFNRSKAERRILPLRPSLSRKSNCLCHRVRHRLTGRMQKLEMAMHLCRSA